MTDDMHSLAASYVVGGLEPDEAHEFEAHLADCPDCQQEVAEMRDIAFLLSDAVATDPPASLRATVLDRIATTPQDNATAGDVAAAETSRAGGRHAGPAASDPATPTPREPAEGTAEVVPIRRQRSGTTGRVSAGIAAAALIAAAVFGGWALNSRNDALNQAAAATQAANRIATVLGAPDVQTAYAKSADGATTTVIRSRSKDMAMLLATDLPSLPSGKTYEAWTIAGSASPVPAGTFEPNGAHTTFLLPQKAVTVATVAVTVEPAGGSQHPSGAPVVAVAFPTSGAAQGAPLAG